MRMLFIRRKAEIEILSSIDHNDSYQTITFDTAISNRDEFQEQRSVGRTMETSIDDQMEENANAADTSNMMAVVDDKKTVATCGSPSGTPMISIPWFHANICHDCCRIKKLVPSPQLCHLTSKRAGTTTIRGARNGLFLYVREKVGRLVTVYEAREE